mmetsp:Transcript_28874/g.73700  ORF Transcript_28874/g.73700 Transcript_28874/m.73700 type:complete len:228 (-) Transcript_28874:396-1079(-)
MRSRTSSVMPPSSRTQRMPTCSSRCWHRSSMDVNWENTSALADGSRATMWCSSSRSASILVDDWKPGRLMRDRIECFLGALGAVAPPPPDARPPAPGAGLSGEPSPALRSTVSGLSHVGQRACLVVAVSTYSSTHTRQKVCPHSARAGCSTSSWQMAHTSASGASLQPGDPAPARSSGCTLRAPSRPPMAAAACAPAAAPVAVALCTTRYGWSTAWRRRMSRSNTCA